MMAPVDPIPALKTQLANEITRLTDGMNLDDAGAMIRADRWRIADVRAGRLQRFSLETLIRFATRLRREVQLSVVDPPPRYARRLGQKPANEKGDARASSEEA